MSDIDIGTKWYRNDVEFEIVEINNTEHGKQIEVRPLVNNCCTFTESYFLDNFKRKGFTCPDCNYHHEPHECRTTFCVNCDNLL